MSLRCCILPLLTTLSFLSTVSPFALRGFSRSRQVFAMKAPAADEDRSVDEEPLFTMGLVADIQHAPIDDGFSFSGNARYYRHALDVTHHATRHFQQAKVDLLVNLGDTVDGKCATEAADGGKSLDAVLQALSTYTLGPTLHTYGNHCLYNADRTELSTKMGIPMTLESPGDELVGYYSHIVDGTNVRIVVLDSYDICLLQRCPQSSAKRAAAVQMLQERNGDNFAKGHENSPEGLDHLERRFVGFNGAVGETQLAWLRDELTTARDRQQKVVVLSHQPLHPSTTNPVCLVWNYERVLEILLEHDDIVMACLAGHSHKYGYHNEGGVHFRTMEAVLESAPPHCTYAILKFFPDRIDLCGYGECQSGVYYVAISGKSPIRLVDKIKVAGALHAS